MSLKCGIVGLGYWGKHYVRILNSIPELSEVVCVCDIFKELCEKFQKQYPQIKNTATSIEEMFKKCPEIDVVFVVTQAKFHFDAIKTCLEHNKHVFVEKPFTLVPEEAKKLGELAKAKGKKIMIGHTFLFNKGIQRMKEMVKDEKKFGNLLYCEAIRHALGPIRRDVGADWDLIPHDISIIQYLLDNEKPEWISATGENLLKKKNQLIDVCFVTIKFKSVLFHIHASWCNQDKIRRFVCVGSKKRIQFDDTEKTDKVKSIDNGANYEKDGKVEIINDQSKKYEIEKLPSFEPLMDQTKYFLNAVKNNDKELISDPDFGLLNIQIMDAIQKSVKQNGTPIKL